MVNFFPVRRAVYRAARTHRSGIELPGAGAPETAGRDRRRGRSPRAHSHRRGRRSRRYWLRLRRYPGSARGARGPRQISGGAGRAERLRAPRCRHSTPRWLQRTKSRAPPAAKTHRSTAQVRRGSAGARRLLASVNQVHQLSQRRDVFLIVAPATSGCGMDLLPNLPFAESDHAAIGLVKIQTPRVPRQTEEVQHPPGPALLVLDQPFVRNFQQRRPGKHGAPVIGDAHVFAVVVSQVAKIVRVGMQV